MNLAEKNITIIGLGMMGGALADGLKDLRPSRISAYDRDNEILEEALRDGVIDFGTTQSEVLKDILSKSDIVFICLYPIAALKFLKDFMPYFKKDSIITDIVGIKSNIVKEIEPILREDLNYIPGHPMAGSEKEGYGGAKKEIFNNKNYILVPLKSNNRNKIDELEELISSLGFSNIVETTPRNHDSKIAYTSQLCHVIASALIDSEDDLTITDYEGGSFGDLTRIAMINAPMWSELFIENKELLLEQIDEFERSLLKIRNDIAKSDKDSLEDTLRDVRKKRVAMEVDRRNKHSQDN